jgi:hypothetical protein
MIEDMIKYWGSINRAKLGFYKQDKKPVGSVKCGEHIILANTGFSIRTPF